MESRTCQDLTVGQINVDGFTGPTRRKKQGNQWDLLGYDLCAVQEHHVTVDSKDDTNDSNYIFNHPQLKDREL